MSTVTMNMSSHEIERAEPAAYGEEIMSSGWNPALALQLCSEHMAFLPPNLIPVDVDAFLDRMYACQH